MAAGVDIRIAGRSAVVRQTDGQEGVVRVDR